MRLKKFVCTLLVGGLLLSAMGCHIPSLPVSVQWNKYESEFRNHWQYRYLSADEKACYGAIYTALTDGFKRDEPVTIEDAVEEPYGVSVSLPQPLKDKKQASRVYNAFFRDNPDFFYVSNRYGLNGRMVGGEPRYDTLLLTFTMDAATRQTAAERLDEAAKALLKDLPQTEDDYITELALHDRLAAACTYHTEAAQSNAEDAYPHAYTAYGALVEGRAVCEGYSRAMQLLLHRVGIPCTLVTGQAKETDEEHMWNLVTVNGRNYHLDVTWDDSEDVLTHTFMNLSTARLQESHIPDEDQSGIDTCTATEDDYFHRNGTYINTYHREDIAKAIAAVLLTDTDTVELRFAEEKFNNGLLFLKNASLTKSMVNAALAAAGHKDMALWKYRLIGRTEQHTITLIRE